MRLVHVSDLHLGFQQFGRLAPDGRNQREVDIGLTWARVVDQIIALAPDVILVGGDVFQSPRPSNAATVQAFREFHRLVSKLPSAIIVIAAGNHDLPRSTESACILDLLKQIGVRVADRKPLAWDFPDRDLAIGALPDMQVPEIPVVAARKTRLLVVHGEIQGLLPTHAAEKEIVPDDLDAGDWDYVALGHWHVHRQVAKRAFYSGSIDYTSSNPWGELVEEQRFGLAGKGFIEYDTEAEALMFHDVAPSRPYLDLPSISAHDLSASEVTERMTANVEAAGAVIDGAVVRQVITDIPVGVSREIPRDVVQGFKRRAFVYQLDVRRPERVRFGSLHAAAGGGHRALAEMLYDHLRDFSLAPDVDREQFVTRGVAYLQEVEQQEVAAHGN